MPDTRSCTYEDLYYEMWEISQRYSQIAQFRVIGKSHDERMIPMVELGKGTNCIFCLSGLTGLDRQTPMFLIRMMQEYVKAWESGWKMEEIYEVGEVLQNWRLCFIPLLNPDGYEIYTGNFQAIRNPIYRQMLRMQEIPSQEYTGNSRGVDLRKNFPTQYYQRKQVMQQPASENETKALIRIFQEYGGRGLLVFCGYGKKVVYYRRDQNFSTGQRCYRLARHLKKCTRGKLEQLAIEREVQNGRRSTGRPEQYYGEMIRQPAFRIELPVNSGNKEEEEREIRDLLLLPLEYIYSLVQL